MSTFVIGYYALLIGASCLAAYFNKRKIFILVYCIFAVYFSFQVNETILFPNYKLKLFVVFCSVVCTY